MGEAAGERLTETGLVVGTAAYMSPEQAAGGPVDARTDVYALGCVLYEMLAGEPPFTGPTGQAMIVKRLAGPPRSLRIIRPEAPPAVDAAIQRALAPAPAARFTSAEELAGALSESLAAEPPLAPIPRRASRPVALGETAIVPTLRSSMPRQVGRSARTAPIAVAVIAVLLMLLALWSLS